MIILSSAKPETILYSQRSYWKLSSSKLLEKSIISRLILHRSIFFADNRESCEETYVKNYVEL